MSLSLFSVSVIIPAYNRDVLLADAIDSVLQQCHHPLEIIVVDDGSTDNTAAVASRYGEAVRYVYQPNAGPAAARNQGIRIAQGDVIGFLDSDDVWVPDTLSPQLAYLAEHPMVEAVIGTLQLMQCVSFEADKPLFEISDQARWNTNLGSLLCHAAVFQKVGMFNEQLRYYEDVDWFLRAEEIGIHLVCLPTLVLHHRLHPGGMTHHLDVPPADFLKCIKNHRDRLRHRGGEPSFALKSPLWAKQQPR